MDNQPKSDTALAVALRALREGKELSLTAVADKLEISRGYLWRLEHGEQSNPSREVCTKLARFYDLDPSVFLVKGDANHLAALSDDGWMQLGKQLTAKQRLHIGGLISDLACANASSGEPTNLSASAQKRRVAEARPAAAGGTHPR